MARWEQQLPSVPATLEVPPRGRRRRQEQVATGCLLGRLELATGESSSAAALIRFASNVTGRNVTCRSEAPTRVGTTLRSSCSSLRGNSLSNSTLPAAGGVFAVPHGRLRRPWDPVKHASAVGKTLCSAGSSVADLSQVLPPKLCRRDLPPLVLPPNAGPDAERLGSARLPLHCWRRGPATITRLSQGLQSARVAHGRFPQVRVYGLLAEACEELPAASTDSSWCPAQEDVPVAGGAVALPQAASRGPTPTVGLEPPELSSASPGDGADASVFIPWSDEELRTVFKKFESGDDSEVRTQDLCAILEYLGARPDQEQVDELIQELTRFSTVSWAEFNDFIRLFQVQDTKHLKEQFEEADTNGEGSLDAMELHVLLQRSGYAPTEGVTSEAIFLTDVDGNGTLDFDEFRRLREYLRKTRGFLRSEAVDLNAVFDRIAGGSNKQMTTEEVYRVITYLGYSIPADEAAKLVAKVDPDSSGRISFDEFLLWNRMMLDYEHERLVLLAHDLVVSGCRAKQSSASKFRTAARIAEPRRACMISPADSDKNTELHQFLKRNGPPPIHIDDLDTVFTEMDYVVSPEFIQETLEIRFGDRLDRDHLLVDQLDDFLRHLRQREGFVQEELDDLESAFQREQAVSAAGDDNEQLDALELGRVLRWFGISKPLQQIRQLIEEVAFRGTRELELKDFMKVMRILSNAECRRRRDIFDQHSVAGKLNVSALPEMLEILTGFACERSSISASLLALRHGSAFAAKSGSSGPGVASGTTSLSWSQFQICFKCYHQRVMVTVRQHAGYPAAEVYRLRAVFNSYDVHGKGTLGDAGMRRIIEDHMPEATLSMQGKEDMKAILAGLPDDDTSEGSPPPKPVGTAISGKRHVLRTPARNDDIKHIDFHQFLHVMRRIYDMRDEKDIVREQQAIAKCGYDAVEVESFRQVFLNSVDSSGEMDIPTLVQVLRNIARLREGDETVLRSLVVELSPERREVVRFPEFLTFMHQVATKNLFGLSTTATELLGKGRPHRSEGASVGASKLESAESAAAWAVFKRKGSRI